MSMQTMETLTIRVDPGVRDLIDRAALATGMSHTEFILTAAHREAEAVLFDQCLFTSEGRVFDDFQKALDKPPRRNKRLQRLLKTPAPWDR
jgi:uncharacterized protein (DUF1778 family)